jgi:hypothetical protein
VHPDDAEQYRIPPGPPPAPGYGPPPGYPPPGHPGYGPPPGYPPPYAAAAPWNRPLPSTAWPHGPGRPSIATTAAVLGFVTGGLTALGSLLCLLNVLFGDPDLVSGVLSLGLLCAAGMIRGGLLLLRRETEVVLAASAGAAAAVLLLALLTSLPSVDGAGFLGLAIFFLIAGSLPVTTAALALSRTARGWLSSLD